MLKYSFIYLLLGVFSLSVLHKNYGVFFYMFFPKFLNFPNGLKFQYRANPNTTLMVYINAF